MLSGDVLDDGSSFVEVDGTNGHTGSFVPEDWISRERRQHDPIRTASPNPARSLFALLLILGGLLVVRYFVRRGGAVGGRLSANTLVRLVSRVRLGARQELVVVRFGGNHLLLGVTADSIRVLTETQASAGEASPVDIVKAAEGADAS